MAEDYDQSEAPKEGKSAISKKTRKRVFGGGNPNVPEGAYGGAEDVEQFSPEDELFNRLFGGQGRQGDDATREMLRDLVARWQPKERPSETLTTATKLQDPVRFAQQQYQARLASDPWGPGGAFEGRGAADRYSPEAIVASGGNTAENQILSAGGGKKGTIDPEELKRMNKVYFEGRRTYT